MKRALICCLLAGYGSLAAALPADETAFIECAAENTAGAIFIHSMLELQGPNRFLEDLSARQQIRATEFILAAEGKQVERFFPDPVPNDTATELGNALDTQTGARLEALGQLLEVGDTATLVNRLTAAPDCGEN